MLLCVHHEKYRFQNEMHKKVHPRGSQKEIEIVKGRDIFIHLKVGYEQEGNQRDGAECQAEIANQLVRNDFIGLPLNVHKTVGDGGVGEAVAGGGSGPRGRVEPDAREAVLHLLHGLRLDAGVFQLIMLELCSDGLKKSSGN